MNKMKKVLLTATLCTLSATSHANPGNCCGWYFEVEPFYAKATDTLLTNSIYAVKVADPKIIGDFKTLYHLNLDNDWGGRIALGYRFPSCCPKTFGFSFEYTYFHNDDHATVVNNSRNSTGKPVLAPAEFIDITDESSAKFSKASSNLKQNYDTLDLLAQKYVRSCFGFGVKSFAGIRYLHLKEDLHNNYEFDDTIESVRVRNFYHVNFHNSTDTIGPHLGASLSFCLGCGFDLDVTAAASLLFGESRSGFNNSYSLSPASSLGTETALTSNSHHDDSAHIIPALSGKVALGYTAPLCNCRSLHIELGYRGDKYFNALDDTAYQQLLAGDDINSNSNYHDFDLTGPYLSLTVRL